MAARCSSCGADIVWVTWPKSGKPMPIDATPDPKGKIAVVAGKANIFSAEDERLHRERYTSHFVTCPNAAEHRQ